MSGSTSANRSPVDTLLIVLTTAIIVTAPLYLETSRDREWGYGLFALLIALLTGIWALTALNRGATTNAAYRKMAPMLGLLLLTQGWVAVQLVSGITLDAGKTATSLMLGIALSLLFVLICGLFHTRRRLTLLVAAIIVSATLQGFYGTLMTLSGIEWQLVAKKESYIGVATGTFYNRNHLAGYLEMAIGLGIGLLLAMRDTREFRWKHILELLIGPKARLRLALVVMVIALVMTRSRMGNTGFFASLLIVGGLYTLINKENRRRNIIILASIILIDLLVLSQYFGLEKLKDRMVNTRFVDQVETVVEQDGSERVVINRANEIRDDANEYAWPQFLERPVTGHGAGSFEATFQQYPGSDFRLKFDHAHNDYMEFAIEYGLIGVLPLAGFVLLALYWAIKALLWRESAYRSGLGFGAAMAILAILIHAVTEFNFQIPANAITFIAVCAIALLANTHSKTKRRTQT